MHTLLPLLLLSCSPTDPGSSGTGSGIDCPTPATWYVDGDGDGFGAGAAQGQGCVRPDGQVANDQDCDDGDPAVSPNGDELCNGLDDDCDGQVDPSTADGVVSCFVDADGDGYGDPAATSLACACNDGLVANDQDCDDTDAAAWPGAEEILYDGVDQDCLGLAGEYDRDGDGYDWNGGKGVDGTDCNDDDATVNSGALDLCDDDIDQDCDGVLDECGFGDVTQPSDAWWTVYRDPELRSVGMLGVDLSPAGDSDGDGKQEILAAEMYTRDDDFFGTRYRLLQAPTNTSGATTEVGDAAIATWQVIDDGEVAWVGGWMTSARNTSIANVDLNDDGISDYVTGLTGGYIDPVVAAANMLPNQIHIWYGPPDYAGSDDHVMDLNDTQTVELTDDEYFDGNISMLNSPGGDEPWSVVASEWPVFIDDRGTTHPAVAVLTQDHFDHTASVDTAATVWSAEPYAVHDMVKTGDVDGDGVRDLVLCSNVYEGVPNPGRVWVLAGPIDDGLSVDDADLTIDAVEPNDRFGYTLSLTDDNDGDGHLELVVDWQAAPEATTTTDETRVMLYAPGRLTTPRVMQFEDAYAQVLSDGHDTRVAGGNSKMVGDINGDGVQKLAVPTTVEVTGELDANRLYLLDTPLLGSTLVSAAKIQLRTDESIDPSGGFGQQFYSGQDYDGDGWPDLVVGESQWDERTTAYGGHYGRFMVFRGAVGGL